MVSKEVEKLLLKVQKPGRYVGGELNEVIKDKKKVDCRFAFCFPDTYEVGMSHLGMKILYSLMNAVPYIWCERVFAPWVDMEEEMIKHNIPLYALESGDPVSDFDFIGFTLQYELSFTNMLNMLRLSGVPIKSCDRKELKNIVVAGGPSRLQILSIFSSSVRAKRLTLRLLNFSESAEPRVNQNRSFLNSHLKLRVYMFLHSMM